MARVLEAAAAADIGRADLEVPPRRPRLYVVSGLRLLREGLAAALARQSTVQLVGMSDLSVPPSEVAACCPDVILLDIYVRSAIDWALPMREANPRSRIVAIGVTEVEPVVIACARAGVSGFVPMEGSAHEVVAAVHAAVRGELRCSPRTAGLLLSRLASLEAAEVDRGAAPGTLTPRECEILEQMGQGLSNKQIARHLAIRDATVKNHVHSILSKLGVSRRGEAVAHWRRDEGAVGALSLG